MTGSVVLASSDVLQEVSSIVLEFFNSGPNDVTNGDEPDEMSSINHRNMSNALLGHERHHLGDTRRARTCGDNGGHHVCDAFLEHPRVVLEESSGDVPLGEYAFKASARARDDEGSDVSSCQELHGLSDARTGPDAVHISPLVVE